MERNDRNEQMQSNPIGFLVLSLLPAFTCIIAQSLVQYFLLYELHIEIKTLPTLVYHILGVALFGVWYAFLNKKEPAEKTVLLSLLMGMLLYLFANGIVMMESLFMPQVVKEYMDRVEQMGMFQDSYSIFAAVFLAPIGEELLCRGVTMRLAKKAYPQFFLANIFQACMFGFIHLNIVQGIYAFAIGLCLGYVCEICDSLIPAMLIHFSVNFTSTFLAKKLFGWIPDTFLSGILLFIIPLILVLLLLWLLKRSDRKYSDKDRIKD